MPINIILERGGKENEKVAWLCDDVWELPAQLVALEKWVIENRGKLPKGSYVADLGFAPRPGAAGGGGAVGRELMVAMLEMGIELFLQGAAPSRP